MLRATAAGFRQTKRDGGKEINIVMVVSPLIALMKDQSAKFTERGITAVCISDLESMDKESRRKVMNGDELLPSHSGEPS